MLAEAQPKRDRRLNVHLWCKFWCNSLAHVIHNILNTEIKSVIFYLTKCNQYFYTLLYLDNNNITETK